MAEFQSFQAQRKKIDKIWNRSQRNENKLKDEKILSVDFEAVNFNKKIAIVPIVENEVSSSGATKIADILFENIPEWIISHINITPIYSVEDGFSLNKIVSSIFNEFSEGTLEIGDTQLFTTLTTWFVRIDNNNLLIKVKYRGDATVVESVDEFGFNTIKIPVKTNISAHIINPQMYENINNIKS